MKVQNKLYIFLPLFSLCAVAHASLLKPTFFPKTVDDLSFVDRLRLRQEGYVPFEIVYDKEGNCVSGCAYAAPKLEDEIAAVERWNRLAKQDLVESHGFTESSDGELVPPIDTVSVGTFTRSCNQYNAKFTSRDIPYGNPLGKNTFISSCYGWRIINNKLNFHQAIDFIAEIGTDVYAPADGTVIRVLNANDGNNCGNGIVLKHRSGYSSVYCHLSQILVKVNDQVETGCLIAKTGNTGRTTGPHLHYAIKDKDNNSIDPQNGFLERGQQRCTPKTKQEIENLLRTLQSA